MAEAPQDPKKEMESWFVEGLEPAPVKKNSAESPPPMAPTPEAKPPGNGPLLLPLIVFLAVLIPGGYYFYNTHFRKSKIEEAVIPKPMEEAPPALPPLEPVVPAAPAPASALPEPKPAAKPETKKKTVVRPATQPARKAEPEEPQRAEKAAPTVEARAKPEQPPAPSSGIILWSGKVEKNGTIVIDGAKSDSGTVSSGALPGVPVTVRVEPKGFTVSQPPSAANGWKHIAIHSEKKAHIVVTVFWNTKPQ